MNLLRLKMSGEEELLCYNRGCGQRYVESKNTEGEELLGHLFCFEVYFKVLISYHSYENENTNLLFVLCVKKSLNMKSIM